MRHVPKVFLWLCVLGTLLAVFADGKPPWIHGHARFRDAARIQLLNFVQAVEVFRGERGRLPADLAALTEPCQRTSYPYMQSIPLDPWGSAFEYVVLGERRFQVRSCGEDGLPDTEDDLVWPEEDGG